MLLFIGVPDRSVCTGFFFSLPLSQRKQRSSSSSMWTALVFSGMPVPDSLTAIDLDLVREKILQGCDCRICCCVKSVAV